MSVRCSVALWATFWLAGCPGARLRSESGPAPVVARDSFLEQYAATYRFRLGCPKGIAVTPDGSAVLFLRSGPRSFVHDLYAFDTATGKEQRLLDARRLQGSRPEQLSAEERARRERQRLMTRGIAWFRVSRDGSHVLVSLSGRLHLLDRGTGATSELRLPAGGRPIDPRLSPDGSRVAYVRDGDLYVFDVSAGSEQRLTHRQDPQVQNGLAEFVAQEEMGRYRGFWWSPKGTHLAYQQTDTREVERLHILDPAHPGRPAASVAYPRAGRANAEVRLGVVPATGGETAWLAWDRQRYPYLVSVKWSKGAPLTLVVQNRPQTEVAVLRADPAYRQTRTLLVERDAAWVNIDPQMPRWLPDGSGLLWTTERRGTWQLELRRPDGTLIRPLTAPSLGYRGLLDVDPKRGKLFVSASPETPREVQLYRLPLKGGAPRPISTGRGWHDAVFARQHGVYVHSVFPLDGRPRFTVHRRDGRRLGELRVVVEDPPFAVQPELLRVGKRGFEAAVVRPRNLDPSRRYPVVLYAYAGPDLQVVTARRDRYLLQQWIADHGFIVVSADGRGTPGRGRRWERAIKGNFIELPLADQVAALQALGRRFPELDLKRVGVLGWSFGGYFAAMAVLKRPDVFRAAVAGAPVTDWRDYDTHYTERYLGLPAEDPDAYRDSSALRLAPRLRRPLLLIHGTVDDNVYFGHSLRLSDRLFRAGRAHDFLPLSDLTHLVPDPLVTRRLYGRIMAFFREHLQR